MRNSVNKTVIWSLLIFFFNNLSALANTAPVVDAGVNDDSYLTGYTLNGSGNDAEQTTGLTYTWTKVSGPGEVHFKTPDAAATGVSFSKTGAYTLRLTVSDGLLSTADDVTITAASSLKEDVVAYTYTNALARDVNAEELDYWVTLIKAKVVDGVSFMRFIFSKDEFENRILSNGDFVDILHMTILRRGASSQGRTDLIELLSTGAATRLNLVESFSKSLEYKNVCFTAGIVHIDPLVTFMTRFYDVILNRQGAPEELQHWIDHLRSQAMTPEDVVYGFLLSAEFLARNTTNDEFISIMYLALFDRAADPGGYNYWVNHLNSGGSRDSVIYGFVASIEFLNIANNLGINEILTGQSFFHDAFNRREVVTLANGNTWTYNYGDQNFGDGNLAAAAYNNVSNPAENRSYSYNYDPVGNRTSVNDNGTIKDYTPNSLNQYTQITGVSGQIQYDEEGNPKKYDIWSLFWDAENRLEKMIDDFSDRIIEFKYDYRGFRVRKKVTVNNTITKHIAFLYDGNLISAEIDITNPAQRKIIRKYTWGLDPAGTRQEVGGIGALVGFETYTYDTNNTIVGTNKYHVVSDAGGSVVQVYLSNADDTLTLVNEYEYGPFGQIIDKVEGVELPFGYQTKYRDDETKLISWPLRYYDPVNGRWLNQDPRSVNGGINTYNFTSNNPVNGYAGWKGHVGGMSLTPGQFMKSTELDAWGDIVIFVHGIRDRHKDKAKNVHRGMKDYWEQNPNVHNQALIHFSYPMAGFTDVGFAKGGLNDKASDKLKAFVDKLHDERKRLNSCEPIFLYGYSNGSLVVKMALDKGMKSDGVAFAGSPIDPETDFSDALENTPFIVNYHSPTDIFDTPKDLSGLNADQSRRFANQLINYVFHSSSPRRSASETRTPGRGGHNYTEWNSRYMGKEHYGKTFQNYEDTKLSDKYGTEGVNYHDASN